VQAYAQVCSQHTLKFPAIFTLPLLLTCNTVSLESILPGLVIHIRSTQTPAMQLEDLAQDASMQTCGESGLIVSLMDSCNLHDILDTQEFAFLNRQHLILPADLSVRIPQPLKDIESTAEHNLFNQ
jgi:hypothetical protein